MSVPPVTGPWFGEMLVICGVRSTAGGVAIGRRPRHAGRAVPAEVAAAPVGRALGHERQRRGAFVRFDERGEALVAQRRDAAGQDGAARLRRHGPGDDDAVAVLAHERRLDVSGGGVGVRDEEVRIVRRAARLDDALDAFGERPLRRLGGHARRVVAFDEGDAGRRPVDGALGQDRLIARHADRERGVGQLGDVAGIEPQVVQEQRLPPPRRHRDRLGHRPADVAEERDGRGRGGRRRDWRAAGRSGS